MTFIETIQENGSEIYASIAGNLSETFLSMVELGGKIIGAIILLLILKVIFSIVTSIFSKLLKVGKVDAIADKAQIHSQLSGIGIKLKVSEILTKAVSILLLIVAYQTVVGVLNLEPLENAFSSILTFIFSNVLPALVIIAVGVLVAGFAKKTIKDLAASTKNSSLSMLANVAHVAILVFIAIPALEKLGVDPSIFQDNISILFAGVALAFGLGGKDVAGKVLNSAYDKLTK